MQLNLLEEAKAQLGHVAARDVEKAPDAFKTIREAADTLGVPQHVLRFWESKFPQINPLKMRGGRRYYRPEDMDILTTIHHLLYTQGYTIDGAKKAFDEPAAAIATAEHSEHRKLAALRDELLAARKALKAFL